MAYNPYTGEDDTQPINIANNLNNYQAKITDKQMGQMNATWPYLKSGGMDLQNFYENTKAWDDTGSKGVFGIGAREAEPMTTDEFKNEMINRGYLKLPGKSIEDFNKLKTIGDQSSLSGIEGYTAAVPEGMRETISDAVYDTERRYGEDTSDLSGIAETSVWGNPRYDTTDPVGRVFDIQHPENWRRRGDKDYGILKSPRTGRDPLDPIVHDRYPHIASTEWWDKRENPALRYYSHLFGDQGIPAVKNVQATMVPEETITAEEQIMTRPDFGRIDPLTTNQKPGLFEGIGQKLGMTQVSPEDRIANKQFMQDQGIRRDPQTGRMIGGDFEGMNPAGKSGWGSANFGEMSQNWMDKYGDVEYSRTVIGDMKRKKQARMKKRAAEYQAKIQQQAIQEKTRQDALRGAGAYSSQVQMDPGGGGTWHGQTAAKEAAGQQVAGPGFGKGAYFYRGGRVGYNTGGRVGILSIF